MRLLVTAMAAAAVVVRAVDVGAIVYARRSLQLVNETPAPTPLPTSTATPSTTARPTPSPSTAEPTPVPTDEPTPAPTDEPTTTLVPTPRPTPKATPKPTTAVPETDEPTPEPTPEPSKAPRTTAAFTPFPTTNPKAKPTPSPTADPNEVETTKPATTIKPVDTGSGIAGWVIPSIVGGAVLLFLMALFLCNRLRRYRDSDDFGRASEPSPYSINPAGTYRGAPARKAAAYLPPVTNNTTFMTNNSSFGTTPVQDHPMSANDRGSIGIYDGPRNSSLSFDRTSNPSYDASRSSIPSYDGRSSGQSYDRSSSLYDRPRHVCLDEGVEARRTLTTIPQNRVTSPQGIQSYTF